MFRSKTPDLPSPRERIAPATYAAGMLALGSALLLAKPRIGEVPDPQKTGIDPPRGVRKLAAEARDGVRIMAPTNVTDSIGRSLLMGGGALLLARLFDEMAGQRRR